MEGNDLCDANARKTKNNTIPVFSSCHFSLHTLPFLHTQVGLFLFYPPRLVFLTSICIHASTDLEEDALPQAAATDSMVTKLLAEMGV